MERINVRRNPIAPPPDEPVRKRGRARISLAITVLIAGAILAFPGPHLGCAKTETPGIRVELYAERQELQRGEVLKLSAYVVNVSEGPIVFPGCLYHSASGVRWPVYDLHYISTDGEPRSMNGFAVGCGLIDAAKAADFVTLPPHGAFNPFDLQRGFFGSEALGAHSFKAAGEYKVVLTIDTRKAPWGDRLIHPGEWTPRQDEPLEVARIQALADRVPQGRFSSKPLHIRVREP
ncbi:MAG: hypothetical protein FLDDKLPJ_03277 [Phycisphaerae bacterium]|nr:hypothetical protein [Phycisphaerae bacterium]